MRSILTELVVVAVDAVECHPDNPRIGDVEAIKKSLSANGQFMPILVQQSSGYIISGNHTYMAAVELGWEEIDALFVDVDDRQASIIMLAANRIPDLGSYNELVLADLLADILDEDPDLLESTGYSEEDIDELLNAVNFPIEDMDDSPEGTGEAALALERLFPAQEEPIEANIEDPAPPPSSVVTEFVIFRFGELRAKVSREAYNEFVREFLKTHKGDLMVAGIAAPLALGVDPEGVSAAVPQGAERWL